MLSDKRRNSKYLLGITFVLATGLLLAAVLSPINLVRVYADDHGNGDNSGNNNHSQGQGSNGANSSTDNSNDNHRNDSNAMPSGNNSTQDHNQNANADDNHNSKTDEKRMEYVNESAEQRHREHLSSHPQITGPYTANMSYSLDASGNATAVSDNRTDHQNATLSLNMSVWKSTDSLVAMDIIGGSLNVGGNVTKIDSGHAYYLVNHPRLIVFGYVVDNSSANTTSHTVKLLKVFAVSMGDGKLPTSSTDQPVSMHILGHESKLVSRYFLNMDGQVKLVI